MNLQETFTEAVPKHEWFLLPSLVREKKFKLHQYEVSLLFNVTVIVKICFQYNTLMDILCYI